MRALIPTLPSFPMPMRRPFMNRLSWRLLHWSHPKLGESAEANPMLPGFQPEITPQQMRFHMSLNTRLAALNHERYGLWPRFVRFISANHVIR
jgi:hypothetical protein